MPTPLVLWNLIYECKCCNLAELLFTVSHECAGLVELMYEIAKFSQSFIFPMFWRIILKSMDKFLRKQKEGHFTVSNIGIKVLKLLKSLLRVYTTANFRWQVSLDNVSKARSLTGKYWKLHNIENGHLKGISGRILLKQVVIKCNLLLIFMYISGISY